MSRRLRFEEVRCLSNCFYKLRKLALGSSFVEKMLIPSLTGREALGAGRNVCHAAGGHQRAVGINPITRDCARDRAVSGIQREQKMAVAAEREIHGRRSCSGACACSIEDRQTSTARHLEPGNHAAPRIGGVDEILILRNYHPASEKVLCRNRSGDQAKISIGGGIVGGQRAEAGRASGGAVSFANDKPIRSAECEPKGAKPIRTSEYESKGVRTIRRM